MAHHQKASSSLPLLSRSQFSVGRVCESTLEMILSRAVTVTFFLIATFCEIWAVPASIIRERHVIHAPIKIKTIHHYKVKKVPIIIRKHLHYYTPREEVHEKPVPEDAHEYHEDEDEGRHREEDFRRPRKTPPAEEYEEHEHAQEDEYEDYEYD